MFPTVENVEIRTAVLAGDQVWLKTVGKRWGEFQLMLLDRKAANLEGLKESATTDVQKMRNHIAEERVRISEQRHMAQGYITGAILLRDPIAAEVTMRIHEKAMADSLPKPEKEKP